MEYEVYLEFKGGLWYATIPEVSDCTAQAGDIDIVKERIRESLAFCLDDEDAAMDAELDFIEEEKGFDEGF